MAWKKKMFENAAELFEYPGKASEDDLAAERERAMMLKELGQMTIENQYLK